MIKFIVYGDPTPQPRAGDGEEKINRHGRRYRERYDPAAKKKTAFLLKCLHRRPDAPFSGPVEVKLTFHFRRPKSHYGSQNGEPYLKASAPTYVAQKKRNDIDNLTKFVYDALNEEFWIDDGMIAKSSQVKLYTEKLPYTEVEIKTIE
jgi:Holliday junction resolvase RusA-like endonuclease